jgi:hypothetical protein
MNSLAIYIASVLATIVPHPMSETRRGSIADDIATVVLSEERAFDDDASGQRTALLLVSIAHYETGRSWSVWVDNGKCNDEAWRKAHSLWMRRGGDCDGGKAWSMWQVHVPGDSVEAGRALVVDRKSAIRAALTIARASLKAGRGLCYYSGETFPHCRLADLRLETARHWTDMFPYVPETYANSDPSLHTQTGIE